MTTSDGPTPTDGEVELMQVTKRFGDVTAVDAVDLRVEPGEFISLLGPSGCGKTTTLRMISGFEAPTSGVVRISGQDATGIPPHKRNVNTVFQSYALFTHLTVADNVAFGLKVKRRDKRTIAARVDAALEQVRMRHLGQRRPAQLSGGQQQRVALARAIVNEPDVLLLDEPLSALDLKLRQAMRLELKRLHDELGMTFVFVTHDQSEAITMSDRIAVMNDGRIHQLGTPEEIYERPATRFVASFIGETNLLDASVVGMNGAATVVRLASGQQVECPAPTNDRFTVDDAVALAVRPQRVVVRPADADPEPGLECVPGVLRELLFLGDSTRATVLLADGTEYVAIRHNEQTTHPFGDLRPGEPVQAGWHRDSGCLVR